MNHMKSPESHLRLGFSRAEITPPVGIYHRMWGAARHDRATGIHRPVYGDVMVLGATGSPPGDLMIRANLDLVGLVNYQHDALLEALCEGVGEGVGGAVCADQVTVRSCPKVAVECKTAYGSLRNSYQALEERSTKGATRRWPRRYFRVSDSSSSSKSR